MLAMIVRKLPLALSALVALAACGERPATDTGQAVHIDSVFPIEEEIRRFRADLPGAPAGLEAGASTSRDALVARFVKAIETLDTAAVREMVMSRAEFAYLYYPFTRFAKPPQELSPALVWFQIRQNSEKGIGRAFRTFGGRGLGFAGYRCPEPPAIEEVNRLWEGCVLRLRGPDGSESETRLFGTILERDGRFKFLSYANDL